MHTLSSDYTLDLGSQRYLANKVGPLDIPTPNEFRAISEIHRCRREHWKLIDARKTFEANGHFEGQAVEIYQRARTVIVHDIRRCCDEIRHDRKARGVSA